MRRRPTARKVVLRLVALEGRDVPATVNWTLGTNGDFANPTAWTDQATGTNHVPGPNDDAVIPAAIVVISSANQTVNSLNATGFQILGGTFTISGANNTSTLAELKIGTAGTLALAGPTGPATIDITAGFDDQHAAHIAGTVNIGPTSTFRFRRGWIYLDPGVRLLGSGQYLMNGDATGAPELILNTNVTAPTNLSLTNGLVRGTNTTNTLTVPTGVTTNWVTTAANGATVAVPTVVQSGATLVIGGLHDETLNATLTNSGTINYQQASGPNSTGLVLGTTGRIDNLVGGTFRINPGAGTTISGALPAVINNAGTMTATGTAINNVTVNNAALVNVQSGVLNIAGGGGTHTGQFTISNSAGLTFTASATVPVVLDTGALITGPGQLTFAGNGVASSFNAGAAISASTPVSLTGGTLKLNAPLTLASYSQIGGTLDGAGTLTLSGPATWSGGTMQGGGTTAVNSLVTLSLTTLAQKVLGQRTLSVTGTVNHTGGNLDLGPGSIIAIQPGGTYTLATDSNFGGGGGTINNQGQFVKTSPNGTGTSTISNHAFNNAGSLRVDTGVLAINSNTNPSTHTGSFAIASGAELSFTAGTQTFISPATFSGGGRVSLPGGTMVLNTALSVPNFNLTGGTVAGLSNLTLNGGGTWTAGAMQGGGSAVLPAGVVLTISGSTTKSLSGRTLDVSGTVNHTDGELDLVGVGTVIAIQSQGTYNLAADVPLGGSGGAILSFGTFTKSSPNAAGGTSALNLNFTNAGTVRVNSGTLFLQQNYIQNNGQTIVLPGANLRVTTFQLNGGILGGTGPINANVTGGGTISPGLSPGALTINGNVNLSGAVVMECNGTTPGVLYDQMIVNGGVNFSGTTLSVSIGYVPTPGDGFVLVANDGTDAISGTFAGLPEGATITLAALAFHISYHGGDGNDVALTSLAVPPPGASTDVNDGAAQRSRVTTIQVTFSTVVTFAGPVQNAFRVSRTPPGAPTGDVTLTVDLTPSTATQTIAKLSFGGALTEFGSLIDGNYTLTVFSSQVSAGGVAFDGNLDGSPGGDLTSDLFRLYGDVNGDRAVNGLDLTEFRNAFGSVSTDPGYVAAFDFNGDGAINGTDLTQFRTRFGMILP